MNPRRAHVIRTTDLAEVGVRLNLDGEGDGAMQTGIPFLDHMLTLLARNGGFDLEVQCQADPANPEAAAREIGICLGLAFSKTLEFGRSANRNGHAYAAVQHHLARTVAELPGHPHLSLGAAATASYPAGPEAGMVEKFWRAFAESARVNLHIELLQGGDGSPAFEAVFKAAGRALRAACRA